MLNDSVDIESRIANETEQQTIAGRQGEVDIIAQGIKV